MIISSADRLLEVKEYYFSAKLKQLRQLIEDGKPVINLGIGSPDQMPDASIIHELERQAALPEAHGYQPYQGLEALTKAITSFCERRYELQLSNDSSILPLMGSKEGITHLSLAYLNPGDQVLVPSLGYPTYTAVTRMVGAEVIYYPLLEEQGWAPDWDFLEKLDTSRVKLMWLNYPHMPTGVAGSWALFERLVAFARARNLLLCHDNPYSFLQDDKPLSIFSVPGSWDVAVELNSLSKTFHMAGWRVGWLLGKKAYVDPVMQIKSNMDSGMFKPIQLAAVKALGVDDGWFENLRKTYAERRALVFRVLEKLGCDYQHSQQGMFVWARVPQGSGEEFSDRLLAEKNIFVTPGFIFGEAGKAFIRISLCSPPETFEEVYQRLT